MECDNGYNCVTIPPSEQPPTVSRNVIETEGEVTPAVEVLASTGMDVVAFTGLGVGLVVAGIVLRWNARKFGRTGRPETLVSEA